MKKLISIFLITTLLMTNVSIVTGAQKVEAATISTVQVSKIMGESATSRYKKVVANVKPAALKTETVNAFNAGKVNSWYQLNNDFLKLLNADRRSKGVAPLAYNTNTYIAKGTNTRAVEVSKYFSHYHPDGTLFKTAFPVSLQNGIKGENVMRRSYTPNLYAVTSEKYLAEMMYTQWRKSPDHTADLLRTTFKKANLQIKIKYDFSRKTHYYYAVQIFTN